MTQLIKIDVLDHGFVALRNLAGPTRRYDKPVDADDIDPANSARMSFDAMDTERARQMDIKLARYLMRNQHTTPIEMIEVWLEMKLPIFVARQFVRHRTVTINEVSGRYVKLPAQWYIPKIVGGKAKNKKQGQEDNLLPVYQIKFKQDLETICKQSYHLYELHIDNGVAPEHARMMLHLNHYTHWLWKQNLHNIMHFLSLRSDNHAQIEAQMYARAIETMLRKYLPELMKLYDEYRK